MKRMIAIALMSATLACSAQAATPKTVTLPSLESSVAINYQDVVIATAQFYNEVLAFGVGVAILWWQGNPKVNQLPCPGC